MPSLSGSSRLHHRHQHRRRRPTTWMVIVALLGLLVGADAVARSVVAGRVEAALACRVDAEAGSSDARLGGAPLAPRLVTGSLGEVVVEDLSGRFGEDRVPADVDVRLDGVALGWWGQGTPTAEGGQATLDVAHGSLPAPELTGEDGLLVVGLGATRVRAELRLEDGFVSAAPVSLEVAGHRVPVETARSLLAVRAPQGGAMLEDREIQLPELPAGVTLREVAAGAEGLTLTASLASDALDTGGAVCATATTIPAP